MGLGPPCCQTCQLIMAFDNDNKKWYCDKCGTPLDDETKCLWQIDNYKQIEKNTKKYNEEIQKCSETKIKK